MKLTDVVPNSCRVCLKRTARLRSLYNPLDEGEEPPSEMLRLISGIELESVDVFETLPKCICKNCELSLSLAYQFRIKVLRTHQIIESYRKKIWCTDEEDPKANDSLAAQVKIELEDFPNCNDDISIDEDHLQHDGDMEFEVPQISVSDLEAIDVEDEGELQMLESNEDENLDEDCKPEYLYDEEFYNVDTTKLSTPEEEENENAALDDYTHEIFTEEVKPDISRSEFENNRTVTNQTNKAVLENTTKEKSNIKETLYNKERIPVLEESDQEKELKTIPEKNKRNANGNTAHICDICGNIYAKRGRMMEHRRRHDKELRFACELCDKRFHLREKLRKHMFLHTGGKPYKCSFCSRTFFYESVKKAHEAVHSGIKPYICDECNKAFAYAHALAKHKLIHADIKLYHCDYCDKDFRLQHHMKQHIETKLHQNAVFAAKKKTDTTTTSYT